MSSLSFFDMVKLTFRVIGFKYEQSKLTTSLNSIVKTSKGSVKGVKRLSVLGNEYFSFEGIPFAKPPVGELRFRAPVPADSWEGVRDCTGTAEKPLQTNMFFSKYKGSEDCLYLNIFTNNVMPEKPRPVMVWIYGGGFQVGDASRDMYSPDFLLSKDIVLVTIAYRLGPFGFLTIDDPEVNIPGNAGLKDQILSLQWVKENISHFGGDPNNVTLFGESAGGSSTHLCMLSERSKGLIHKAIVMSGSALCPWARQPPNQFAYRLAKILGYEGENNGPDVCKFLQQVEGPELVKANGKVLSNEEKHNRVLFAFGPVVEPYATEQCVIAEPALDLMKKTWSNDIPMMIGGTSFEGLLFHPEVTRRPATLNEVKNCKNLLPIDLGLTTDSPTAEEYGLQLKKTYFGEEECSPQTMMKFLDLESYREFWHPMYRTARHRLENSSRPTYLYRFDFDSKEGNGIRNLLCGPNMTGTCHGDDLCYIFHGMFSHRTLRDSDRPEHRVVRTMVDILTSFAATGDPNCESLNVVKFEPLSKDALPEMKCLNIREKPEFIPLPELERIRVWDGFYADGKL